MFKKILTLSVFMVLLVMAGNAGASYTPKTGDLLRTPDDSTVVLVMDDGKRIPISADGYALRYNNNFGLIKVVTVGERGSFSSDFVINSTNSLASGTVFMYEVDQPGFYLVENGFKRLFSTWTGFEASGHRLKDVQWAGLYTVYPTGAAVQ